MPRRLSIRVLASAVGLCVVSGSAAPTASIDARATSTRRLARTVLALYDGKQLAGPRATPIHNLAEMSLNHLGLVVRYHDIQAGLPAPDTLTDVRGALTWFTSDAMARPSDYLRWIEAWTTTGKPLVIMGTLGALRDDDGHVVPVDAINRALARLGWRYEGVWQTTTSSARFETLEGGVLGFERPQPRVVPPYAIVRATAPEAKPILRVVQPGRPGLTSDVVIIGPRGTYVAPGFAYFSDRADDREFRQWYVNPFELFRRAFATDDLPKPDTSTLSGRRIFYSHIDGDGWRNLTQIEPYRARQVIASEVVLDEVIRKTPDLPVTVGAIVGDLDKAWMGTAESLAVAKAIYGLPHVEPAIHTYSHPLDWEFFDAKARSRQSLHETSPRVAHLVGPDLVHTGGPEKARSYDVQPFSLATEIDAAAAFVNQLLPAGKRVGLVQWTGDTRPFADALRQARRAGLDNINGGDTRFDREFPSAAWVSPLGEHVGGELQVYASNSNENTYTDLWRDRFFGFSFLSKTVHNTGTPRRLKPFNLYYHMYSGERLSSLNAVLANIEFARSLPLAPIETSRFSRIVQGFFTASLELERPRTWRVRDRGALQTLRFDHASHLGVDFERSQGVIGQRHELGGLFVALDESVDAPLVCLKTIAESASEPLEQKPYLVESRWRVSHVRVTEASLRFVTQGYGAGESSWRWPSGAPADVRWRTESGLEGAGRAEKNEAGLLVLRLPQLTSQRVDVSVSLDGGGRGRR